MSQTAQTCTQCGTRIEPGQRFCASCGAPAPQSVESTTAAAPTYASPSSNPSNPGYPGGGIAPTVNANSPSNPNNPAYPDYLSTPMASSNPYPETPSYLSEGSLSGNSSPYTQYPTPAPPAPPPTTPSLPYYTPPTGVGGNKQRPAWFMPVVILVALVVVAGAGVGIWSLSRGGGSNGGGGGNPGGNGTNYPSSQNLNLQATYASVQLTFTSLQQASKFSDDTYTSMYGSKKNWVRLNFKENLDQADASNYVITYSYNDAFTLILPDGSSVASTSSKDFEGPQAGVSRSEWVDFGTSQQVDLSQLKLRLGAASEAQEEFPLKNNADLSQYQPKTQTLNKSFLYASENWVLNSVTQSYYYGGSQAKKGNVFLVFSLTVSNNTSDYTFTNVYSGLRLKAGDTTSAPDDTSNLIHLDDLQPNTTNVKGTGAFDVTKTPDNKYTLIFPGDSSGGYSEVDEAITIS